MKQPCIFPSTRSSNLSAPLISRFTRTRPYPSAPNSRRRGRRIYILAHSRPRSVDDVDVAKLLIDSVITRRRSKPVCQQCHPLLTPHLSLLFFFASSQRAYEPIRTISIRNRPVDLSFHYANSLIHSLFTLGSINPPSNLDSARLINA